MIAKLHLLPGGESVRAEKAASAAVNVFEGDPKKQAEAWCFARNCVRTTKRV
jgi:hypothetical protein